MENMCFINVFQKNPVFLYIVLENGHVCTVSPPSVCGQEELEILILILSKNT